MPQRESPRRRLLQLLESQRWREALLALVTAWNRNQLRRIAIAILATWLLGTVGLHLAEQGDHTGFDTWGESLWSAWVLLFSGSSNMPGSLLGRILAGLLLVTGVALAGLFTATVASVLVEQYLRRREVTVFPWEGHLVLCNWSSRGPGWIREVHSALAQTTRPVVIIHENPDAIHLPPQHEDSAFRDVYTLKGDPVSETVLRRARVPHAYSVVILADERQGEHADGKTILTCLAVRHVCRPEARPGVAAECLDPRFQRHIRQAGADEVITAGELGLRLLARAALFHGMTRVYQELLTVGRDTNEVYLVPTPPDLVGQDFVSAALQFLRHRADRRACLLVGVRRGEALMLNPLAHEVGTLREGDELVLLSQLFPDPTQPLPTVPPSGSTPRGS